MPSLVGQEIGHTGYGTMSMSSTSENMHWMLIFPGMTWVPQPPSHEQCFETLDTALNLGANFWNGGELYGTPEYNSLHLLNKYFTKNPEKAKQVVLSIKGGLKPGQLVPDGSEANIRRSVDESLRVLDGKKTIDIFECARQDPNTTVEQTVTVLAQLVKEGKIGGIGLSEVDAETIQRAYVFISCFLSIILTNNLQTQGPPHCSSRGRTVSIRHHHSQERRRQSLRGTQHPCRRILAPRTRCVGRSLH